MSADDLDNQSHGWTREREAAFMNEVREEAKRIDPRTARMVWWWAEGFDPYGLGLDIPDEASCIGRAYFLIDPNGGHAIRVSDVRAAHPDIPDREWEELMHAAHKRDTEPDAFPMFHAYATPEGRAR